MKPRIALRFADWPAADQAAWRRAITPPDSLFDPDFRAARLSARTIETRENVWGFWLEFLARNDALERSGVDAVTPELLDAFIGDQRDRNVNNGTIAGRLGALHTILGMMAPGQDFEFILRPGALPLSRAFPHVPKRSPIVEVATIMKHVQKLHKLGLKGASYAHGNTALRDAAFLGVLATRAPRIGSMAAMELGVHLIETDEGYRICFGEADTKNGKRLTYDLPPALNQVIADYLKIARPALGGVHSSALWLSTHHRPMTQNSLSCMVERRTMAWFGVKRGPHWFRACLKTTAVLRAPHLSLDAASVLGHSPQVSLQHYNQATAVIAAERYSDQITELRQKTAGVAQRLFAKRGIDHYAGLLVTEEEEAA